MSHVRFGSAPAWLLAALSLAGCGASSRSLEGAATPDEGQPQLGAPGSESAPGGDRPATDRSGADSTVRDGAASVTSSAGDDPARASSPPGPPSASATDGPGVSASVAMTQQGSLEPIALVAEINRQRRSLQPCGPLVRRTDGVVGSLNLQITVDRIGRVEPELQSPVNPEARECLLAAARGWRIRGAGRGEAMVLLVLDDQSTP